MTVHRERSMKREDQQDATIRCLLLTSVSTCFGYHYDHLQENKGPVTAFGALSCNKRENADISRDVFYFVVNLVWNSCVFANLVYKWAPIQRHDTPIYTRHSQTHTNSQLGLLH